jgi:hypothetical protein
MDIEKIKNYNQKILAVFLTLLVALAAIGLLSLIIFLLTEVFDFTRSSSNYPQEGIQVDEKQQYAEETDTYKLHASYNFPDLIDTINQIYIIPVSHQTQYEIENNLIKRGKFSSIASSDAYDYYSQSTFINLLVYDAKNAVVDKLFNQQILVGQYGTYNYKDDIIIVFEASDKDSNKDGKLTLNDETSLYFYSIRNKSMKVAEIEGQTVLQFSFIGETRNAIIRFGENPDLRNEKEKVFSPGILCQFNYDSDKLVKINDPSLDAELENIAGGKNK